MSEQEYLPVGSDFNPGHPEHAAWRGERTTAETPAAEIGEQAVLDLDTLTDAELRAQCKAAKLPTTGKHDELVARLAEHAGAQLLAEQNAE